MEDGLVNVEAHKILKINLQKGGNNVNQDSVKHVGQEDRITPVNSKN